MKGSYMDIIVRRTEEYFTKIMQCNLLTIDSVKKYLKKDNVFNSLNSFRFSDNYLMLSKKVYSSLSENPLLINEIEKVSKSIHIDETYLSQISNRLPVDNRKIEVCTGITGFDCAAGAYGNTIYFGLEWFCNPDTVGIVEGDYRYKYMKILSASIDAFFMESIPHEMVHILSEKPDVNNNMFRILEEGRACYVTHLLFPEWPLHKVLPMKNDDIDLIRKNEEDFLKVVREMYLHDAENAIKMMFSPVGEIMDVGLSGYYIAYKIFERKFSNELDIENRIRLIMRFTDCDELLNDFVSMSNS